MLQVKHVTFGYSKTKVLKAVDFKVEAGENLAIIGESGSGKSTLLKLIYGEYDLKQGHIFWKDEEILGPKHNLVIGYDFMKYVTQEFDLMPFITVEENIGKYLSRFYPEEKQKRTAELIKVVELEAFSNTKVKLLSGGQKQRVAIARALAKQPEILLLDEPFSHIDNFKKQSLRRSVFKYLKDNNIACVVATHDKNDVLGFSDQLLVIHDSKIIEKDTPQHIYNNPKTPLIASFFGEFNVIAPFGIVYANQIKIVAQSNLKVIVKTAYFNGSNWLIEAEYKSESIFIEHSEEIKSGTEIYISIAK
ncbi:ABC transporter ATP-binding protein [Winogradskyella eckloniae]|uniref:ABC transporter ATP-binding protein n=1 Tax=Winogradskyella eckloniae TaxID=1089306 RepID=UPI001563F083|nr:ABC transporter ATP-binding protein [Winogradskyella eckloniae]NRD18686.1 ABC transporter ATP-binding protein [Winogradskyella eckloniae]